MKSVVFEKHEFQSREESISQTIMGFVVYQFFNAEKSESFFWGQYSLKSKVFSTATFWEELKHVIMKTDEPKNWNLSIIEALQHSWTVRIPMQNTYQSKSIEESNRKKMF